MHHQPVFQAFGFFSGLLGVFFFFPSLSRSYFWTLGSPAQSLQSSSEPIIKTNLTSRKQFHISLSHLWKEIRQRSWLFRKFTVSLGGNTTLSDYVLLTSRSPAAPTVCSSYRHFLPLNVLQASPILFKQMLCFTCHSPIPENKGQEDIRHHTYHFEVLTLRSWDAGLFCYVDRRSY